MRLPTAVAVVWLLGCGRPDSIGTFHNSCDTISADGICRDYGDARLPVFPHAGDDAYTVTQLGGVRSVQATGYGNPVTYTPEDRPTLGVDGDPLSDIRVLQNKDKLGLIMRDGQSFKSPLSPVPA